MKTLAKKAALRLGRPVWKRLSPKFYLRIDRRIDMRLAHSDAGWKQLAPAFLNAASSVQSFGRDLAQSKKDLHAEIAELRAELARTREDVAVTRDELWSSMNDVNTRVGEAWSRIEFVRREIMFEMRYSRDGANGHSTASERTLPVEARIVRPDRVSAADDGLRLNLGCGHIPLDGYINVDARELPGVDVVAEVGALPFEAAHLKEVYSAHLLEHFPQEELRRRLLPYWHSLLRDGGEFRAITPDAEAMLRGVSAGTYDWDDFREVLFGGQDYEGDFHYNLFTPASLTQLLEEAGFRDVRLLEAGRRNGKCFEFEVAATK